MMPVPDDGSVRMRDADASVPFGLLVAAREPIPVDEVELAALV